jgi:dipeptidyl aminopeptidase/acylaminoacyl peptidase
MNIWRIAVDEATGKALGPPEPITVGGSADRGQISLSADGRRLAYAERSGRQAIQKVAFDPDREVTVGSPVAITRGSISANQLDVSPDGEWLVYNPLGGQEDIHVCRADGGGRRQLTDDAARDRGPTWSPDGKRIAFFRSRGGHSQIWLVNADGSGLRQLTHAPFGLHDPRWSADGTRLVARGNDRSYVVDLSRGEVDPPLTELPPVAETGTALYSWSWSRDGRMLAGDAPSADGSTVSVFVLSLESGASQRVARPGVSPVWLSDDRRLIYNWGWELHLANRETLKTHRVLSLAPDGVGAFALSRDDRWIYFVRSSSESDLWLLTLR